MQVSPRAPPPPRIARKARARSFPIGAAREREVRRAMDEEVVPVLHVEDAVRAIAWYERLGGLARSGSISSSPGSLVRLRGPCQRPAVPVRPRGRRSARTPLIHLYVTDIDAVSEEFGGFPSMRQGSPAGVRPGGPGQHRVAVSRPGAPDHERRLARPLAADAGARREPDRAVARDEEQTSGATPRHLRRSREAALGRRARSPRVATGCRISETVY